MSALLTVEGITKYFNQRRVLDDVSFSVRPGEVLGLIGPNGSGKTTLFEFLAGSMPTNSGALKSNNKELTPSRSKDALFYLPDAIFPWAEQSVRWVLDFFRKLYERSEQDASALVGPLRLDELMKARIGSLSKGERKRVLLALGLLTPPPFIILDEPFYGSHLPQHAG